MNAEIIAKALDGRRAGAGWMAHCPAHDDRTPSLSVRDSTNGKVLLRCHAGCEQERVIAALRTRGLWGEGGLRSFLRQTPPPVVERLSRSQPGQPTTDNIGRLLVYALRLAGAGECFIVATAVVHGDLLAWSAWI